MRYFWQFIGIAAVVILWDIFSSNLIPSPLQTLEAFNQIITSIESTFSSAKERPKVEVKKKTLEKVRAVLAEK